jgi:hypothetical protein
MPETLTLSADALALLTIHFGGRSLAMGGPRLGSLPSRTVEETRIAYRELVTAGLMMPLHSFIGGRDSLYRLTDDAKLREAELTALAAASLRSQST